MAFCPNCGTQIPENADFCGSCGKKISNEVVGNTKTNPEVMNKVKNFWDKNKDNKKFKMILLGVLVALALIIVAVVVKKNLKAKIDLNDYVTVEYTGHDSAGYANANFDYDKFEKDVASKMKVSSKNKKTKDDDDWSDLLFSEYWQLEESFDYSFDKKDGLSNGDTIKLSWTYDEDVAADSFKIKLVGEDKEYTVDGLEEVKEVDPFEDLSVSFDGVAPNISVTIKNNSKDEVVKTLSFSSDAEYGEKISVGDTITISVNTDEDMLLSNYGYKLTQVEKEYTCDGVDEYVTTLADVNEDLLTELQAQSQDALNAYIAQSYDEDFTVSEWNYQGSYFLIPKSSDTWGDANDLILVYSTTVSSISGEYNPVLVYFPVEYGNIVKHGDGTEECEVTDYTILGYTYDMFGTWGYSTKGYVDTNEMYSELITEKIDQYTYEVSESLQQYGN